MGCCQTLSEVHVTVAVVLAPVSSTKESGAELLAPLALFQLLLTTTPATSEGAIGTSPPTKSILIVLLKPDADVETVKVTVAVCTSAPLVPVIVNVELPRVVLPVVDTVNAEVPEELIEVGEKTPVAPAGNPLTLNVTVPANPVLGVTFTP
jgi:hypothetical protein